MASLLTLPSLSKLPEIRSNGLGVPILFLVGEDGLATVMALHISIRFCLQETSIWIEREVYDPLTLALSHIISEASKHSNDSSIIWTLKLDKYKVYGLISFQMSDLTQFVTPCQSSTCTITPCLQSRLKLNQVLKLS